MPGVSLIDRSPRSFRRPWGLYLFFLTQHYPRRRKPRYERGSVLLTSNPTFNKWTQIFKEPMTTVAAIERLVQHEGSN